MKIEIIDWGLLKPATALETLRELLVEEFLESRFVLPWPRIRPRYITRRNYYVGELTFGLVTLTKSKLYCGNHPSACELGNKDDKKSKHLEGACWVEFDDRLNDILDKYHVSADAGQRVVIRQGNQRCIEYLNGYKPPNGNYEWSKYGRYADYCGRNAPRAKFPEGTPGDTNKLVTHS